MIYHMWGSASIALAHLRKGATIGIYTQKFEYLSGKNGLDCRGEDPRSEADCLTEEVASMVASQNYSCLPSHFAIFRQNKAKVARIKTNNLTSTSIYVILKILRFAKREMIKQLMKLWTLEYKLLMLSGIRKFARLPVTPPSTLC